METSTVIAILKLVFYIPEGKITCILIIELRMLLKSKSYYITIFHSLVQTL